MLDWLAEIIGRSVPHFAYDEGTDLRRGIPLSSGLHPSVSVRVGDNLVGNIGDVLLDLRVLEFSTDQSDGVSETGSFGLEQDDTCRLDAKIVFSPLTTA